LALTASPTAAASPTKIVSTSLGANAVTQATTSNAYQQAMIDVTQAAPGQATISVDEMTFAINPDGSWGDVIESTMATGTVSFDIDLKLAWAHAYGTVDVSQCAGWCNSPNNRQGTVDVTWTAATRILKTHLVTIGSVSKVSRTLHQRGTSFTLANATASLDGTSLGTTTSPTMAEIYDSTNSETDTYFGIQASLLPGKVQAGAAPASKGGIKAPDLANGRGPGTDFSQAAIDASWESSYGTTQIDGYFGSSTFSARTASDLLTGNEAWFLLRRLEQRQRRQPRRPALYVSVRQRRYDREGQSRGRHFLRLARWH
jgi:hypothetical protein